MFGGHSPLAPPLIVVKKCSDVISVMILNKSIVFCKMCELYYSRLYHFNKNLVRCVNK